MRANATKIVYPELSYTLNGILFKVHNDLGRYRNERQYQDAIERMLQDAELSYEREKELSTSFDGEHPKRNICDFVVENKIIIEVKVKRVILKEDYFQIQRYLTSSNLKLGIIVNFRQKFITPKRVLK